MSEAWSAFQALIALMQAYPFETLVAAFSTATIAAITVILATHQSEHMGDGKPPHKENPGLLQRYEEAKRRGGR